MAVIFICNVSLAVFLMTESNEGMTLFVMVFYGGGDGLQPREIPQRSSCIEYLIQFNAIQIHLFCNGVA